MIFSILVVGLFVFPLFAEDFSFIGIKWNDDFDTVRKKIDESGLCSDSRLTGLQRGSMPVSSILKESAIDEERYKVLTNVAVKIEKDLRHERQLKYIEFRGKRDSIIKNASFFFAYDRDILLAYYISLNTSIAKIDEETGEGEFYQDLLKKYGAATKTLKWSKMWSQNDQTLYYTAGNHAGIVTYISESNISSYLARIGIKSADLDETNRGRRPGDLWLNR